MAYVCMLSTMHGYAEVQCVSCWWNTEESPVKQFLSIRSFALLACVLCCVASASLTGCDVGVNDAPPSTEFTGDASGCGDIFVYRFSVDGKSAIVISAEKGTLGLSSRSATFDIGSAPAGLRVWVDRYASRVTNVRYCSDLIMGNAPVPVEWKAVSGRVTIQLSSDTVTATDPLYKVNVQLEDVVVQGSDNRRVSIPTVVIADVTVGWYAG